MYSIAGPPVHLLPAATYSITHRKNSSACAVKACLHACKQCIIDFCIALAPLHALMSNVMSCALNIHPTPNRSNPKVGRKLQVRYNVKQSLQSCPESSSIHDSQGKPHHTAAAVLASADRGSEGLLGQLSALGACLQCQRQVVALWQQVLR